MSSTQWHPRLPPSIVELYGLAKEAFVYHEQRERKWDTPSLVAFRDALDDLVKASATTDDEEARDYVATASEHLSLIIAEALQRATEERLLAIDELTETSFWRRNFYQPNTDNTPSRIEAQKQQVGYHLNEGRNKKASININDARAAFESFKSAYGAAVDLEFALKQEYQSRRLRVPVTILCWLGSMVLAGLIGFGITLALT